MTTTGPAGSATTPRALLVAVCATATRAVPEVPDDRDPPAVQRAYLVALEGAMGSLASDVDRLASRSPAERNLLGELSRRMRGVAAVARRRLADDAGPATDNDLASSLARLNVAATRERLPQCGV